MMLEEGIESIKVFLLNVYFYCKPQSKYQVNQVGDLKKGKEAKKMIRNKQILVYDSYDT